MRFGIIGTGGIADACHVPAVAAVDGASLVAVLSRDAARGAAFAAKHNAPATVHTDLNAFLNDAQIDAVIIASPDKLHAQQATTCLNAGKHVLLEKPLATSAAEADAIADAAAKSGKTLMVGFHLRQHAGHKVLYDMLQQGTIGALRHIRVVWAFPNANNSNWRAHDDLGKWWSLAAVGSHCFDIARWFAGDFDDFAQFGSTIDTSRWGGPHDETAVVAARFASGATLELTSSVKFGPYNRIELFGEKGFLVGSETFGRHGAGKITLDGKEIPFQPVNPFAAQLQVFIDCVNNGVQPANGTMVGLRSTRDLLQASA